MTKEEKENLERVLKEISSNVIGLAEDTMEICETDFQNAFPMDLYKPFYIDGKLYRLKAEFSLKRIYRS